MHIRKRNLLFSLATMVVAFSWTTSVSAASVTIDPPATPATVSGTQLQVTTSFGVSQLTPPASTTWTIVITNTGPVTAKSVTVQNLMPVEFTMLNPAAAAELAKLGDLAPGESVTQTLKISVGEKTPTNRYIDEATVSASNVDAAEYDSALDIANGQVLGASDSTLAATGISPAALFAIGALLVTLGAFAFRRLIHNA